MAHNAVYGHWPWPEAINKQQLIHWAQAGIKVRAKFQRTEFAETSLSTFYALRAGNAA